LLDNEQEWIEKYRAALVQSPPSRRVRLAAAFSSLASALGFAIGRTSGKRGVPVRNSVVPGPSHEPEAQKHRDAEAQPGTSRKSSPPEHRQDKKAS